VGGTGRIFTQRRGRERKLRLSSDTPRFATESPENTVHAGFGAPGGGSALARRTGRPLALRYHARMSRYRPARPPASPYITAAGYRDLEIELKGLWERRADVVRHLAAAAAEGDRSENAEYQYRKKELRGLDARIGYLQRRMPALTIVGTVPADTVRVYFGATVELADEQGDTHRFRIVGSDETDAARGHISIDSPLARALLGTGIDSEIRVVADGGSRRWCVLEIRYEEAPA